MHGENCPEEGGGGGHIDVFLALAFITLTSCLLEDRVLLLQEQLPTSIDSNNIF